MKLETRAVGTARTDSGSEGPGSIVGLAVPRDEIITHSFGRERVDIAGARAGDPCLALAHHDPSQVIGTCALEEAEDGLRYTMTLADTALARDMRQLAAAGALRASIGFSGVPSQEDQITVWRDVTVHEVSLVAFPAYSTTANPRYSMETGEERNMNNQHDAEAAGILAELRSLVDSMRAQTVDAPTVPAGQYRNVGEHIQAMARGDEAAIAQWRAIAADDAPRPHYIDNLELTVKINRPLVEAFGGPVPVGDVGMSVDYPQIAANTVKLSKQATEGEKLATGKVALRNATAPLDTYGGYITMSVQQLQRTSAASIAIAWDMMAALYARETDGLVRDALLSAHTSRAGRGVGTAVADAGAWIDALLDALDQADTEYTSVDALVVSATTYKDLAKLLDVDGRRFFRIATTTGGVGHLSITAGDGGVESLPIIRVPRLSRKFAAFVDRRAVRLAEDSRSPMMLQSQMVPSTLAGEASLYGFAGAITPLESGVTPVRLPQ